MTQDAWIMLAILAVMFAMLIWDRFPAWVTFMGTLAVCMTIGLASEEELLRGFGNPGVVTVAVLFVVAAGMYSTGAITLLANRAIGIPKTLREAHLKILPPTAVGSAFLNNTPLVAMMIPVIRDITRATGLAGSKLYMPLSFSSLLGGAATLIGTSVNLIIAGLVLVQYGDDLNVFFPTLVGAPVALLGIAFLMTVGVRLLADRRTEIDTGAAKRRYRTELLVQKGSPLEGQMLEETGLAKAQGYELIEVRRRDSSVPPVAPDLVFQGGDLLSFAAEADSVPVLWSVIGLVPHRGSMPSQSSRFKHSLVEVVISPRARAVGHRIGDLPVPESPYEVELVGISRDGEAPSTQMEDVRVQAGDAGIMEVNDNFFYENRREVDFTLIKRLRGFRIQRTDRAMTAATITVAMVVLAALGVMSMLNAALLASAAMLLTGCIGVRRAFASIEWGTIVVLGAAVGLEAAVTNSGLSEAIANLIGSIGSGNATVALAAVFVGAVIMTNVITNAAAAAFMFPIAVSLAGSLGVNYQPFVVVLMLGCSYAFINPAGYQTNLMVQGPGRYTFQDFALLGVPLTVIVGLAALLLTPILYPF